jgi:predicted AlkP superfamily pyrophosphatase or phosphodiesterase
MSELEKTIPIKGFSMSDAIHYENPITDEVLSRFAGRIIELKHPHFTTLHVVNVDHVEHVSGPGTKEAHAQLEKTDAMLGTIIRNARKAQPDLVVVVVSDHGFVPVKTDVNLMMPFVEAGLVTLDAKTRKVTAWKAMPWPGGGSVFVMLADPNDKSTKIKVEALLKKLADNPKLGIDKILSKKDLESLGAASEASFGIALKYGYEMISTDVNDPLTRPATLKGMHGYLPTLPEMGSVFIIAGPGITKRGSLGVVDMRDVAPTVAKVLGVTIPSASGNALNYSRP